MHHEWLQLLFAQQALMKCLKQRWWLLLLIPVFSKNVCGKHDEIIFPDKGDEYVAWNFTGTNGYLTTPNDQLTFTAFGSTNTIYASSLPANTKKFALAFAGPFATGSYNSSSFLLEINGRYYLQGNMPVRISITNFGGPGEYIIGNYAGTVKDSSANNTAEISGDFRIKNR